MYTPPSLYNDYHIPDDALKNCIAQTIEDQRITQPADLKQLLCSYSGIESISGISHFSRIERLSLKGNPVTNVDELFKLTYLSDLDLSDSGFQDCQVIAQLSDLLFGKTVHSADC